MLSNNKNNNLVMNPFAFDDLGLNDSDLEIAEFLFYPLRNFYDKCGNYVDNKGTYHDQDDERNYGCLIPNGPEWYDNWQWSLEDLEQYIMVLYREYCEVEQIEALDSIPEEAFQQYGYHNMNYLHQILPSLK